MFSSRSFSVSRGHHRVDKPSPNLYRCSHCNYSYASLGFLRRHLIRGCNFLPDNAKSSDSRKSFKAACGGEADNSNDKVEKKLPIKRKVALKTHPCPNCSQMFKSRETLISHLRDTCGQKPKYKCPYCDLRSKRPHNIKAHVRNRHKGEPYYLVHVTD